MRVAFVAAETDRHRDAGRVWHLEDLAQGLAGRDQDVVYCCTEWAADQPPMVRADGLTYRPLAPGPEDPAFEARLPGAIDRFDPDVVHAVGDWPRHLLAARAGASLSGAPLVADWWTVPGEPEADGVAGAISQRIDRLALRAPAVHLAPSRLVRRQLRERGVSSEDIDIAAPCVDYDLVRAIEPVDGGDVVYAGELDDHANLGLVLLALAEHRERDWSATVIGDGPRREEYEQQACDLRIEDRVTFTGAIPTSERIARYKHAHAFVHTAERTPFALELLRALSCGCVGVVTYGLESAAHELVEQYDRAVLLTEEDDLAAALTEVGALDHRAIDERFAEYDREAVLDKHLERYRTLRDARLR